MTPAQMTVEKEGGQQLSGKRDAGRDLIFKSCQYMRLFFLKGVQPSYLDVMGNYQVVGKGERVRASDVAKIMVSSRMG